MKTLQYLLISILALIATPSVLADGNTDEGSDPGDEIIIQPGNGGKDDGKARMPAYSYKIVHYSAGILTCSTFDNPGEILQIQITGLDNSVLFHTTCQADNLTNGVYIGYLSAFTLTITTSSGAKYSGIYF